MIDFKSIDYLKSGNPRQRLAYQDLREIGIMERLQKYAPILVGTVPIEIDIPSSDLDIICSCQNHAAFEEDLKRLFSHYGDFEIHRKKNNAGTFSLATFQSKHFEIEIYGQNRPTDQQNAYRHMIIEYQILQQGGSKFKEQIIRLKQKGIKTEPAFAKLLKLEGDPYQALFNLDVKEVKLAKG